jgi:hypothetical protein
LSNRLAIAICGCLVGGSFVPSCEVPHPSQPASLTSSDDKMLLPYQGPVRSLFDDGIDPTLFGADNDLAGENDRRLNERIRSATVVVVVQVTTVSDESNASLDHLELEVEPVERPILGSVQDGNQPLRLNMSPGTASYGLARSNQRDLIGKRIILCLGRFLENGQPVTHWHGMAADPQSRNAVAKAASIADLEK